MRYATWAWNLGRKLGNKFLVWNLGMDFWYGTWAWNLGKEFGHVF